MQAKAASMKPADCVVKCLQAQQQILPLSLDGLITSPACEAQNSLFSTKDLQLLLHCISFVQLTMSPDSTLKNGAKQWHLISGWVPKAKSAESGLGPEAPVGGDSQSITRAIYELGEGLGKLVPVATNMLAQEVVQWCGALLLMTDTPKEQSLQELRTQFPSSLLLPGQATSAINTAETLLQLSGSDFLAFFFWTKSQRQLAWCQTWQCGGSFCVARHPCSSLGRQHA